MEWADLSVTIVRNSLLLMAVVNPIGNIPVYADLTRHLETIERIKVMNLAVLTALCIVIAFSVAGNWALANLFNVNLMELRIAGGILLFIVAIRGMMPRGKLYCPPKDVRMVAVFPIAFPMMVGPGTITATIIAAQTIGHGLTMASATLTFLFVFLIARNAHNLMRLMGPYAGTVIARLLYIFLAAKAVSMVLDGIAEFLQKILT